ncbi:gluconate 2-dehydrogenase subunit 3 family protein [Aliikangiella maris]|uniref:Gluconate 2-dehydrogenase subunit 3 family protein n=2 Tax=Aliikangiella maris TaxID=3162458 RepID=A0ABV2BZC8_9GAMM
MRKHVSSKVERTFVNKHTEQAAGSQTKSARIQTHISPVQRFPGYRGPLASGYSRRDFLKTSIAASLLGGLLACKPTLNHNLLSDHQPNTPLNQSLFTRHQQMTLQQVQMHLFPDDGNGPSAKEINAFGYLEWALNDPKNIDDGDPEFIQQGVVWLDDLAQQTEQRQFIQLSHQQQHQAIEAVAASQAGKNWLSLLLYYLTEALLLDPVYGGNTNQIGWQWLQHQAGFPRPEPGKTFKDFT